MFGNFIQFIVVLLIYATYQPEKETNFGLVQSTILFFGLPLLFSIQAWITFRRLENRIPLDRLQKLDHRFNSILLRQSILAIGLFTADIYALNLTSFLSRIPGVFHFPTLQALFCLLLFIGYLSIIWALAYKTHQQIYPTRISRSAYVISNISFAVPVLLPWLVLSAVTDLIDILPFEFTRRFFSTMVGQIAYFLTFLFGISIIGPAIIQKFWQCKPLEKDYHRDRIESLCKKAGVAYRDILYWPIFGGQMITAGVMGLIKKFRYILVTNALLRYLSPDELDAVIAHEIGHVKKHHLFLYLMFFIGFLLLSLTFQNVFIYLLLYTQPIYRYLAGSGISTTTFKSALDALVFILIFVIYFRYIFGFFMRNFERQADAYVFSLLNNAHALKSTLNKIAYASGQAPDKPNWHHFSITERVGFINKCEVDRGYISLHNRKILISISAYLIGLTFLLIAGYQFNYGKEGQAFFRRELIRYLQDELREEPQNATILKVLGDLYYEDGNFKETISVYEKALQFAPANPHVLNNLAWLYATCPDETFRNPKRALFLSTDASRIERTPQILDTLAESQFINGEVEAAIESEKAALELAGENREYYQKQLERFIAGKNQTNSKE